MLVSGLQKTSLSKITSGGKIDYLQVHDSLCQCARDILTIYEKKQASSPKRVAKTLAIQTLLFELGNAPADQGETRVLISHALEKHVEALQGHEHLLSARGNNYALMEQTKGLRKGDTSASLLRYHELKNKLLDLETPLGYEQRSAIFLLAENKSLTLKTLEILEAYPYTRAKELKRLNKIVLLEPDLCAVVFKYGNPVISAMDLHTLYKAGFMLDTNFYDRMIKHENPARVARAFVMLYEADLLRPGYLSRPENLYAAVFKHKNPVIAAETLVKLDNAELLETVFYAEAFRHENFDSAIEALLILSEANLLEPGLCAAVFKCKKPDRAAKALVELKRHKLKTLVNCSVVLKQEDPLNAAETIVRLYYTYLLELNKTGLLTQELWAEILEHAKPDTMAEVLVILVQERLYTPGNYSVVLKQEEPDKAVRIMVRLSTTILERLNKAGLLAPELWAEILQHEKPDMAAAVLVKLYETDLFKPHLYVAVLKHRASVIVTESLVELKKDGLYTPGNCSVILKQEEPDNAVRIMVRLSTTILERLNKAGLLTPELWAEILQHEKPFIVAEALATLYEANLFKPNLCAAVLKHNKPDIVARAFVELKQQGLDTRDNCSVVSRQENPYEFAKTMVRLNEAGLLTPELWAEILPHEKPAIVAEALMILYEANLFKPNLCVEVLKHNKPDIVARAFVELKQHGLDTPDKCSVVSRQENPCEAAETMVRLSTTILVRLNEAGLLTPELWAGILEHENSFIAAAALVILDEANLFKLNLCIKALKHNKPDQVAEAFVQLNEHNLATEDNYSAVLKCREPYNACWTIIYLNKHKHRLLTDMSLDQILSQENPAEAAKSAMSATTTSLSRYDKLKNKLLGPDTPMSTEQREFIYKLSDNKGLTPEILEILEMKPVKTVTFLMQSGILEREEHEEPDIITEAFVKLVRNKLDTPENRAALKHRHPCNAVLAIMRLDSYGLLVNETRTQVLAQEDPVMAARELVKEFLSSEMPAHAFLSKYDNSILRTVFVQ